MSTVTVISSLYGAILLKARHFTWGLSLSQLFQQLLRDPIFQMRKLRPREPQLPGASLTDALSLLFVFSATALLP